MITRWVKHTLLAVLVMAGAVGCVMPQVDSQGQALPSDRQRLRVPTSTGILTFTRPKGWRIIQLPSPGNPTCIIGHVGLWGGKFTYGQQPSISVFWREESTRADISQEALHNRFLSRWRRFTGEGDSMFGLDAGSYPLRRNVHTASGKPVDIYLYAGAPFLDLVALLPALGGHAEATLQSTELDGIYRDCQTFVDVVRSVRFQP